MNFPVDATSFIGRRADITTIKRLLSAARLVTLTGVGGVGKTRLAQRVAGQIRRSFGDGIWLVELAELQDAALVPHAILESLRIHDDTGRDPVEVLAEYLAERDLLLVLDNCEHLVEDCADIVNVLLRAAPGLRVLATSRERLAVADEQVWDVRPLELPDSPESVRRGSFPALDLFAARANAAEPSFRMNTTNVELVAAICRLLDGVPLAIELAAVRVRVLSLKQLLDGLSDSVRLVGSRRGGPSRHQTLYAAVEWSYQLCSPAEQTLWTRASVFVGGFDLAAAVAVCSCDSVPAESIVDLLASLVEKSVLVREGSRFRLLETLRQHGREKLDDAEIAHRHRDYYLTLAERGEREWFGPNQPEIFERTRLEHANLRAALEVGSGLRLSATLGYYWTGCGVLGEGRHWLDRALALNLAPSRDRAKALWVNGYVATLQGDFTAAIALLEECRTQAAELGDHLAVAYATHRLGCTYLVGDDITGAIELLTEAQRRYTELGETNSNTMLAWVEHGIALVFQSDFGTASTVSEYAYAIGDEHGERWAYAYAIYVRALVAFGRGDYAEAGRNGRECLNIKRTFHDLLGIVLAVEVLAWAAAEQLDSERAATLLGATSRIWRSVGYPMFGSQYFGAPRGQCEKRAREALGDNAFTAAVANGAALDLDAAIAYALRETPTPEHVLTEREWQVARLVAAGLTNRAIAAQLVIALRTAESHVERVLRKLGYTSRTQVITWLANDPR